MLKPEDAEKVLTKNLANVIRKAQVGKTLTAAERALIEQTAAGGSMIGGHSAFAKTYDELAQRFGISRKTLQNASKRFPEEVPTPRADGRHDVAAWSAFLVRNNIARTAEHIAGAASEESFDDDKPITVTDWKAKELELKCEKLAIENAKVAGELVIKSDVESGTSVLVTAFRQALNNFCPRLAQKILNVSDYHEAESIIQVEIDVVLRSLQHCEFLDGVDIRESTCATASPVIAAPAEAVKELPEQQPLKKGKPRGRGVKKATKKPTKKATAKRK